MGYNSHALASQGPRQADYPRRQITRAGGRRATVATAPMSETGNPTTKEMVQKMKKLMMVLATAFAAAMPLMADMETVDGITWNYAVSDGKVEVCNGGSWASPAIPTSTAGAITIPSTLGGCPVTSIGREAFYDSRLPRLFRDNLPRECAIPL